MTIQDALEKAKRLSRERASPATGGYAPDTSASAIRKRRRLEPESASLVRLNFEPIAYNQVICEENRILIPNEGDERLTAVASDSYRMLRTRLMHRMKSKSWTILGVTSPGPEEGKSVTALNLALSMAREKKRNVFLIDLDLRSPSLCPYLGIEPSTEITRFFDNEVEAEQLFFSIGVDNLAVAGGLISTSQSSELLSNGRLEGLIAYVKSLDPEALLVIDLPPVLNTADVLVAARNP